MRAGGTRICSAAQASFMGRPQGWALINTTHSPGEWTEKQGSSPKPHLSPWRVSQMRRWLAMPALHT